MLSISALIFLAIFSIATFMSPVSSGIARNNFIALDLNSISDKYPAIDKLVIIPFQFFRPFDY